MIIGVDTSFLVAIEIENHALNKACKELLSSLIRAGHTFATTDLVLWEFLHVITDAKRFFVPVPMSVAIEKVNWFKSTDAITILYPSNAESKLTLDWLVSHRLGRKRIMDTYFAATLKQNDICHILTLNWADFEVFGYFTQVTEENLNLI